MIILSLPFEFLRVYPLCFSGLSPFLLSSFLSPLFTFSLRCPPPPSFLPAFFCFPLHSFSLLHPTFLHAVHPARNNTCWNYVLFPPGVETGVRLVALTSISTENSQLPLPLRRSIVEDISQRNKRIISSELNCGHSYCYKPSGLGTANYCHISLKTH